MVYNFLRRASEIYTLRHHRANSILVTDAELIEVCDRSDPLSAAGAAAAAPPLSSPAQAPAQAPAPAPAEAPRRRRLHRRHPSNSPELSPSPSSSPSHSPPHLPLPTASPPTPLSKPIPLRLLPHIHHHHIPHPHIPHRSTSPDFVTDAQLLELRASQRTFEGAYIRTALGLFSFALIVLKIFTAEFYSIGALFAGYGASVLLIALYRRHQGNRQYFGVVGEDGLQRKRFRTSGNVVLTLTALSVVTYAALLALVIKLF